MEAARPAGPEDRAACRDLLEQALQDVRTARGGAALVGPVTAVELLDAWFAADSPVAVFIGTFHEATVGLLAVTTFVRPGSAPGDPSGRIECCYVEAECRGVGVGSALMTAAVEWCEARLCVDIDARALPGDRNTKQRLEAAGFTARLLTLNRRLR
ncbi:MAG TPA: GNAT family N-acetyltransferase [Acidimicrobiales bacterium]|jgi:GNAT superfamily N-acetyltransferase